MGIKRKLSSKSGASIVFALAIFLVSTIISLALISISLTSAKSSAMQLEDEQAYLAVSSAARLLQKQMSTSCAEVTYDGDGVGGYVATPSSYEYKKVKGTGTVPTAIQNLMQHVITSNADADLTITPADTLEDKMGKVTITIKPQILKNAGSGSETFNFPYNSFKAELKSDDTKKQKYNTTMYFYVYASTEVTNTVNADGKTVPLKKVVTFTWDVYGQNNGK